MDNSIEKLLNALPAAIAKEKRQAIQHSLEGAGLWEHYRQNISKPGKDLGKINLRAADIICQHLGLTYAFFLASFEEQDEEIKQIVRYHYKLTLQE